ncbi:MAG: DUF805 domain-containing protein [Alphaproteobacteria bacterium]|nr:DUF805 domain-containing protein [Alphaproteobacteria bacterium]
MSPRSIAFSFLAILAFEIVSILVANFFFRRRNNVFTDLFGLSGRINRGRFLIFFGPVAFVQVFASVRMLQIGFATQPSDLSSAHALPLTSAQAQEVSYAMLAMLATLWPMFALQVKRFHDVNKTWLHAVFLSALQGVGLNLSASAGGIDRTEQVLRAVVGGHLGNMDYPSALIVLVDYSLVILYYLHLFVSRSTPGDNRFGSPR